MAVTETAPAEQPTGVFLSRQRRYIVGCDLGYANDPTAICVVEKIDGVLDFNSEWERHTGTGLLPQQKARRLDVRFLQRLPLKLPYPDQIARVKALMGREPLCGVDGIPRAELVFDGTGVGVAVAQEFDRAGIKNNKVMITGSEDKATFSGGVWHVGKSLLVSTVDALLNNGELRFAKALSEAQALELEFKDFRRMISATGRSSWSAREGAHDDLLLSVCLAVWWATRPEPPQAYFTTYGSIIRENRK